MKSQNITFSNLFILPPSCLKYSQSSKYIDFVKDSLEKDILTFRMNGEIQHKIFIEDEAISRDVSYLDYHSGEMKPLTRVFFNDFKEKWLESLKEYVAKRELMTINISATDKALNHSINSVRFKIKHQIP